MGRISLVLAMAVTVLAACGNQPRGAFARPLLPIGPQPTPTALPDPEPPPVAGERLEVLTYNTWGKPGLLGTRTKERFQRLQGALGRYDWVTLQEAFSDHSDLFLNLPAYPFSFWQRDGGFFKINSGLFTLSRHRIIARDFRAFPECAHSDCLSNKGVMWTRLQLTDGRMVDLYNTHYQAEPDDGAEWIRTRVDNRILAEFVQAHDEGHPTFLQGDFNFIEGGRAYTDLRRRLPLRDLWREAKPDTPGYSFDPRRNPNAKGSGEPQQRLDYLFVVDNARHAVQVEAIELAYTEPVDGLVLSDHYGVRTRIRLDTAADPR